MFLYENLRKCTGFVLILQPLSMNIVDLIFFVEYLHFLNRDLYNFYILVCVLFIRLDVLHKKTIVVYVLLIANYLFRNVRHIKVKNHFELPQFFKYNNFPFKYKFCYSL